MRRLALIAAASLAFIAISEPPSAEARPPRDEQVIKKFRAEKAAVEATAEAKIRAIDVAAQAKRLAVIAAMKKELRALEKTLRDRLERQ